MHEFAEAIRSMPDWALLAIFVAGMLLAFR